MNAKEFDSFLPTCCLSDKFKVGLTIKNGRDAFSQ
jgi:hypothetical protein